MSMLNAIVLVSKAAGWGLARCCISISHFPALLFSSLFLVIPPMLLNAHVIAGIALSSASGSRRSYPRYGSAIPNVPVKISSSITSSPSHLMIISNACTFQGSHLAGNAKLIFLLDE